MEPDALADKCVDELMGAMHGITDETVIRSMLRCAYFQGRVDGKAQVIEATLEAFNADR